MYQRAGQGDLDRNDLEQWVREMGDDIDRPDVQGLSMLMWASAYGQTPTVQLLLSRGAEINLCGKELETPLHLAAASGGCGAGCGRIWCNVVENPGPGCHELVTLLLRAGARVDGEDENGWVLG